jgi:hypothetical protein
MQMRSLGESEKALESASLPVSHLQTPPLSRNDYFGDWQTPPSYPYGLLQRDVIIAALGGPLPSEGKCQAGWCESEEERVLKCKGLRGLRVGANSYAKSA